MAHGLRQPARHVFAPFPILFTWLVGLLSLALLGGGVYLLCAWYVGWLVGSAYVVAGLAMTGWSLLGRWIVLLFHPHAPDEPHSLKPESEIRLPRPDGIDTSHTNPARTTTARGFVRGTQQPVLEPLLHVTKWLAPLVSIMSWLGYINGSAHLLGMFLGFAGSQSRGQLDLAARYNPLAWPGVQASETLAMFRYDAAGVLESVSVPTLVCTGHLDRLIVPETAAVMTERMPRARLLRLKPAGHMSIFELHDSLTSALAAFSEELVGSDTVADGRARGFVVQGPTA